MKERSRQKSLTERGCRGWNIPEEVFAEGRSGARTAERKSKQGDSLQPYRNWLIAVFQLLFK